MEREKAARVLIVDDMPVNRMILSSLLASNGVESDLAKSGQECLELCRQRAYDLILLDHRMPEIDGVDTLVQLKEMFRKSGREVPVVCHTTEDARRNINLYKAAGFSDVLIKPIQPQELSNILMTYLPGSDVLQQEKEASDRRKLAAEEEKLPAWVREIPGIDAASGIAYCETAEDFLDAVGVFASSIAEKADEIERFCGEGNLPMYALRVHSLKSTARLIGARTLSERAADLERAAKDRDEEAVRAGTPRLLAEYRGFDAALSVHLHGGVSQVEDGAGKAPLPREIWEDARGSIVDFAANYDADSIGMVLRSLRDYQLSDEERAFADRIEDAVRRADWETVRECL